MGRLVLLQRRRTPVILIALIALCVPAILLVLGRPAHAGTALNQLCGSAKLGDGCIGAFRAPTPTIPRMTAPRTLPRTAAPRVAPRPQMGGAFGGMGGAIMGMFLEQALSSALESAVDTGAEAAAQAQAEAAAREVQALQEAVRQQQKLQEERENAFISQLADRPASEIIGGSGDLGILEAMRAEAGAPFDGNDPHSTWTTLHDSWFAPEPTAVQTGSSPVPTGDAPVAASLQPINCMGKICAFPPGSVRAPIVKTAPTGPGSQPGLSGSSSRTPNVVTQWRQADSRVVWAARREFADAMDNARSLEIPAQVLGSGAVSWAEQALPGMQQEIAREGRDLYQRVMEELIAETFGVISDAVSGRWESARERSDSIGDRVRETILPEFKMARMLLEGDGRGAGEVAGDEFWEHAKDTATEKAKEALDLLPGPEWVREGAGYSYDMADHWLQLIGVK